MEINSINRAFTQPLSETNTKQAQKQPVREAEEQPKAHAEDVRKMTEQAEGRGLFVDTAV